MGLRFRKSIKLGGGFRLNLSKSGVGYSWGTKGFRISKSAKGRTRKNFLSPRHRYFIFYFVGKIKAA